MDLNLEKLKALAQPRSSSSIRRAQERKENYGWRKKSQDVALAVYHYLRINGMTQKQLAERMGVSAPYVAKLLKGTENMTLETIDRIEEALGTEIVHINRAYETVIPLPFTNLPESGMLDRSRGFSGKTDNNRFADAFNPLNYAV